MTNGSWFGRRPFLPLILILVAGCSNTDFCPFTAERKVDSSPGKGSISLEEDRIVSAAKEALAPVIAALETNHRQRGCYPPTLDELVRGPLLAKAPELPPADQATDSGLEYRSSATPDFFLMIFRYKVELPRTGFVVIDAFRRIYASDDRRGWVAPDSVFLSMGDLVAERLAPLWRERHDPEILNRFMDEVVATAECEHLLQSKLVGWLGEGSVIKVPSEVLKPEWIGYCNQAEGNRNRRYCFVYKSHWFGHFTCGSAGALTKGPLVYKKRRVLHKHFLVGRDASGKDSWKLLRSCPPSPNDRPPSSGPGVVVEDD
jgi:hypothetical protein